MAGRRKGQLFKHCNIFQWIEERDSEFAQAIKDRCLEHNLLPRDTGVTFLYPEDKKYRQEIIDMVYSEQSEEAAKPIMSLIIPDAFVQGSDFQLRPVGSKLGVKYEVVSADSSKVKLEKDVELKPSDFNPFSSRVDRLAVWIVSKGRPPLEGAPYQPPAPRRVKARRPLVRQGGGDPPVRQGGGEFPPRMQLAVDIEKEFNTSMLNRDGHNPYLNCVVSILNFLQRKAPDTFLTVLPILDYDPVISFYLLIEPNKTEGEYLIPEGVLFGGDNSWNSRRNVYNNAVAEYTAIFDSLSKQVAASNNKTPLVFRDYAAVATAIDAVRAVFNNTDDTRTGPKIVRDAYSLLEEANTINGQTPILPDATKDAITGSKKRWQDELRYILHDKLNVLRQSYTTEAFTTFVRELRTSWPGNDYSKEAGISIDVDTHVSPREPLTLLAKFVNSTDFLYMPVSPAGISVVNSHGIVDGVDHGVAIGNGDTNPKNFKLYNRNRVAFGDLASIKVGGGKISSDISEATFHEIKDFVDRHGVLPARITALTDESRR